MRLTHAIFTKVMLATLLLTLTAQTAWAQTPASIGSIQYSSALSAYEIKSVDNLNDLAIYVNGSGTYSIGVNESNPHTCSGLSFKMTDDITYTHTTDWNASDKENNYTPIGTYDNKFMGTFDGQGHTISGIRIVKNSVEKGLFGCIYGATVMNITLTDTRIAGYNNVGGIAGYTEGYTNSSTIIRNCHVADNVSIAAGYMHSGGIVGSLGGYSSLSGCTSAATVSGNSAVGGIAGYTNGGSISECLVLGATVSGTSNVGAIIGQNNSGTLSNDYYTSSTKVNGAAPSGTGQVRSITAGANVILDYAVSANTQLDFNGIAFYNSIGMKYANALYTYNNNNAVNLSLSYNHTGYTVTGYSATTGTFSGSAITGSNDAYTLTANADVVINATETANTYSVVFNGNGNTSGSMDNESFTYDETAKALTANAFTRTGYTFAGWATSAEGAVIYADQAEVQNLTATANGIFDLYAKWTENVATLTEANPIAPLTAWSGQQTKVTFTRSGLTAGAYSTICLPYNFTASETCTFYKFDGVKKVGDNWVADISTTTGGTANTPYIFTTDATSVTFSNNAVVAASSYSDTDAKTTITDWTFQGTYSQISLPKTGEYDYGFAAGDGSTVAIGTFVHLKSGASAAPFRAYLKYTGSDDNWAKAPNRAGAANDAMPSRIIVRIVGADGGTTAIGTLDTRTGEISTGEWFDLNGRRLQGKPSTKGVYINNGKKIVIK